MINYVEHVKYYKPRSEWDEAIEEYNQKVYKISGWGGFDFKKHIKPDPELDAILADIERAFYPNGRDK